jgi:hypothetical protein
LSISDDCKLSVEAISDPWATPDLMEFWRTQAQNINSDPDFYSMVVALRDNVISPLIFLVREEGVPVVALVCRLEHTQVTAKIAYFTLARLSMRSITLVYGGLIGADTPAIRRKLLGSLLCELKKGTADVAVSSMLRVDSLFRRSMDALALSKWRFRVSLLQAHYVLQVPDTANAILAAKSSKRRKKLRYSMRKTESNLPKLRVNKVVNADTLDQLMLDLENVASKTYQRGLGAGFHHNEEWRELLKLGFEKNWLEVWTLSTGEKCISFIVGLKYKGRFLVYAKAFDPAYTKDNVGTYLQIKLLEDVAEQGDCSIIDYGFGEADYKRQFSTDSWQEATASIAAPSIRNIVIMNVLRFCGTSDKILRTLSEKLTLTQRIKKTLRSKKARRAQERD